MGREIAELPPGWTKQEVKEILALSYRWGGAIQGAVLGGRQKMGPVTEV